MDVNWGLSFSVLGSVLIPSLSAWFGAYVATKKFKRERRWEMRHEAATDLLRSIQSIRGVARETADSCAMLSNGVVCDFGAWAQEEQQALKHLRDMECVGALLFSQLLISSISSLNSRLASEYARADDARSGNPSDYEDELMEHSHRVIKIVDDHAEKIVSVLRSELA